MIWDRCWSMVSTWSSLRDLVRDKNWKRSYTWPILWRTSLRITFWYIHITRTRLNFPTYISYLNWMGCRQQPLPKVNKRFQLTYKVKICSYAFFTGTPVDESCSDYILNCQARGVEDGDFISFSASFISNDDIP